MKMPLREGDALIRMVLLEQWHLEATVISFIPIGNSAYSYRLEAQPNSSFYLKVVDQRTSAGRRTAAHMDFSLPLQNLIANLHLAEVNAPLPSQLSLVHFMPSMDHSSLLSTRSSTVRRSLTLILCHRAWFGRSAGPWQPCTPSSFPRHSNCHHPRIASQFHLMPICSPIWQHLNPSPLRMRPICSGSVRSPGHDVNRFERFWPTARNMQEKRSKRQ